MSWVGFSLFFLSFFSSAQYTSKQLCIKNADEFFARVTSCTWESPLPVLGTKTCDGALNCQIADLSTNFFVSRGQCTIAPTETQCLGLTGMCGTTFRQNEYAKCNSITPDPHYYPLNGPIPPTGFP